MVRYIKNNIKPTEEEILKIKTPEDSGYMTSDRHAEVILELRDEDY